MPSQQDSSARRSGSTQTIESLLPDVGLLEVLQRAYGFDCLTNTLKLKLCLEVATVIGAYKCRFTTTDVDELKSDIINRLEGLFDKAGFTFKKDPRRSTDGDYAFILQKGRVHQTGLLSVSLTGRIQSFIQLTINEALL